MIKQLIKMDIEFYDIETNELVSLFCGEEVNKIPLPQIGMQFEFTGYDPDIMTFDDYDNSIKKYIVETTAYRHFLEHILLEDRDDMMFKFICYCRLLPEAREVIIEKHKT